MTLATKLAATAALSLVLAAAVGMPPDPRPRLADTRAATHSPSAPTPDPSRLLEEISTASGGVVGVHAIHVESGRTVSLRSGDRFPMASTYKLPIAIAVLRAVDAGTLSLDRRIVVQKTDLRRGMGNDIRKTWKPGLTLTLRDLVERMVIESDNTATDLVFRALGGPKVVAAALDSLGVKEIDVHRTELQLDAESSGVTVPADQRITIRELEARTRKVPEARREAARARFAADPHDTATPEAMATLLVRLHRRELLTPASTDALLDLLRRCRTGDRRIRALLPAGTVVLDKTGTMTGVCNDVGIVVLPDGTHLALAVYLKGSPKELDARERTVAEVARSVYDHLL